MFPRHGSGSEVMQVGKIVVVKVIWLLQSCFLSPFPSLPLPPLPFPPSLLPSLPLSLSLHVVFVSLGNGTRVENLNQ